MKTTTHYSLTLDAWNIGHIWKFIISSGQMTLSKSNWNYYWEEIITRKEKQNAKKNVKNKE